MQQQQQGVGQQQGQESEQQQGLGQQQQGQQSGQQQGLQPQAYHLETLTHMFVRCPAIRDGWVWFARVWDRVQPGSGVDCSDVRVLLLDDGSVWQPPAELQRLWTHLRLLMLESVWVVRCAAQGQPYSSTQVVSRFRAALQQQLKQDWARTLGDIRSNSGVPLSWLRGRDPVLARAKFEAKWRGSGMLYTVSDEGTLSLCLPQ